MIPDSDATKEIAKATGLAIETIRDAMKFFYSIAGGPAKEMAGILTDHFEARRYENKVRMLIRLRKMLKQEGFENPPIPLPLKMLPAFEASGLEDDAYMRDVWARLLASSVNPSRNTYVRPAFIEIVKQLEGRDVRLLKAAFDSVFRRNFEGKFSSENIVSNRHLLTDAAIKKSEIIERFFLSDREFLESLDNLYRLRLLEPYVETRIQTSAVAGQPVELPYSAIETYSRCSLTPFGLAFILTCVGDESS